jgi:hypothetical protein
MIKPWNDGPRANIIPRKRGIKGSTPRVGTLRNLRNPIHHF